MGKANAAHWTQAIMRVDRHVGACKAEKGGCHKPNESGYPACATARRLMRSEDRIGGTYRKAGGTLPPE